MIFGPSPHQVGKLQMIATENTEVLSANNTKDANIIVCE